MGLLTPQDLRTQLREGREVAFLDVREEGPYSRSQPLFAVNLPLSRLEDRIFALVPRRDVPIALFDGGLGLAVKAFSRLVALGYSHVQIVDGGLAEWRAAGGELFRDVNVPSKSFGEWVEAQAHTPSLAAEEVKALQDSGADVVLLDSRPFHEYQAMTIPGSISCPGAELVLRAQELVTSPDTLVIVNCAGRTRSLIGAQSLVNSGLFKRVAALRNGTIGWTLAGYEVEKNANRRAPAIVSPQHQAKAREAARGLAERAGVRFLSDAQAAEWEAQSDRRTLFRFDVRSPEEVAQAQAPGFLHAPGGQLVQATDEYVGVQGARLLLADDDGVRAAMTASWLRQLGWREVAVLDSGLAGRLVPGLRQKLPRPTAPVVPGLSPAEAAALFADGKALPVDLRRSPDVAKGHIAGSWFALRSQWAESLPALPRRDSLVLISDDGQLAAFAQEEIQALTERRVVILDGGIAAWRAADLPLVHGRPRHAVPPDDVYKRPYEGTDNDAEAMRGYIDWEFGLVEQIRRDGTARFEVLLP